MRRLYPLTAEEQDFATSWHFLVDRFLRVKRLPRAEYYDVAVFGFLEAVQKQFYDPIPTEKQNFEALAAICMRHAVLENLKYRRRAIRCGTLFSLDESLPGCEDDVSLSRVLPDEKPGPEWQVEHQDLMERALRLATQREREVIDLVCLGYAPCEISQMLGIAPDTGRRTLYHFRRKARALRDDREIVKNPYYETHRKEVRAKQAAYQAKRKVSTVYDTDTQEEATSWIR